MAGVYEEVEIEDFTYDDVTEEYKYYCPCGDKFVITKQELADGEDIARCPSCSLIVRVIYNQEDFIDDDCKIIFEDDVITLQA
jgi:diphthamide biosynthesis protein 3